MKSKINKKGVSVIIGYVLLVVIVISISIVVYAWLKAQLPGETKECPDSVSLVIDSYSCESKTIHLTFQNKGLFNIDGFVARVKNVSGERSYALKTGQSELNDFPETLKPNNKTSPALSYAEYDKIVEIEIEPFISEKQIVLCDKAVISQTIEGCN